MSAVPAYLPSHLRFAYFCYTYFTLLVTLSGKGTRWKSPESAKFIALFIEGVGLFHTTIIRLITLDYKIVVVESQQSSKWIHHKPPSSSPRLFFSHWFTVPEDNKQPPTVNVSRMKTTKWKSERLANYSSSSSIYSDTQVYITYNDIRSQTNEF